jgi:hypothetical protein
MMMRVQVELYSFFPLHRAKRNKTTFSVGLIVTDNRKNVYLIERYLPYPMEDYIYKKRKHLLHLYKSEPARAVALAKCLQKVNYNVDLERFLKVVDRRENDVFFEDQFDFPRGQCKSLTKEVQKCFCFPTLFEDFIQRYLHILLRNAWREWFEETGLRIKNWDFNTFMIGLSTLRAVLVEFIGGDGYTYTQLYFIIRLDQEVVAGNRIPEFKCIIASIPDAAETMRLQDKCVAKESFKTQILHLLLNDFKKLSDCGFSRVMYYK